MPKNIFNKKNYSSDNGFQTSVWGPLIWQTFHIISFNYPVNPSNIDKKNYKNWLLSFQFTLPCVYCRMNFKKNLKEVNFNYAVFNNRETFSRFIYDLHNCVNRMLGKKIKISYEEVRDRYEHFRSRCSETEQTKELKSNERVVKKEKKCDASLYGPKSKTIIRVVPTTSKIPGFVIDKKCQKKN
jgi:hypothetical protein